MNQDFLMHFSELKDPRVERTKRYPLMEILFLIVSATVSGCDGWKSVRDFGLLKLDWLRNFFPYAAGIPVDDTLSRVMQRLDNKQFALCFTRWIQSKSPTEIEDVIAIDGKTLRHSYNKSEGKSAIHRVSAWSSEQGLVLGQEKTAEKSNEITAIPELLDAIDIKSCVVTIDAMGCQTAIAKKIIDKKANYVLALKGNQGLLHSDIEMFFSSQLRGNFKNTEYDFYEEVDAGHGRIEQRCCWAVNVQKYAGCFVNLKSWKNITSIIMVQSQRQDKNTDRKTADTRYYISSCEPSAQKLLNITRKHWGIENSLHWTLDLTFGEDASRIRTGVAAENYAIFRHIALNLIRKDVSIKASVKRKRSMAALDDNFRTTLMKALF